MPFYKVNFNDVESFEAVPEDEYGAEIEKIEVRENKNGDALYLNWEFVIIDGDYENQRLWLITSLKDTALFRLKQVLVNLDILDEDAELELEYDDDIEPSTKEGPRLIDPDLEGMEVTIVVKNEMYDGREQNRVKDVYYERPKKKKSAAKKRSTRDEYEEDEQPRKRVTRARDEDEQPTRRRREVSRDRDDDEDEVEEERPRRREKVSSSSRRSSGPRRRIR